MSHCNILAAVSLPAAQYCKHLHLAKRLTTRNTKALYTMMTRNLKDYTLSALHAACN